MLRIAEEDDLRNEGHGTVIFEVEPLGLRLSILCRNIPEKVIKSYRRRREDDAIFARGDSVSRIRPREGVGTAVCESQVNVGAGEVRGDGDVGIRCLGDFVPPAQGFIKVISEIERVQQEQLQEPPMVQMTKERQRIFDVKSKEDVKDLRAKEKEDERDLRAKEKEDEEDLRAKEKEDEKDAKKAASLKDLKRVEKRLDEKIDAVENKVDRLQTDVDGLKSMSGITIVFSGISALGTAVGVAVSNNNNKKNA